jgi:hypothetical protein
MPHGYQVCANLRTIHCTSVLTCIQDFVGVDKMKFLFELGKPFLPFEQLMGVLPEASKELVPQPYRVGAVFFLVEWSYILCYRLSCMTLTPLSSTSIQKILNKI